MGKKYTTSYFLKEYSKKETKKNHISKKKQKAELYVKDPIALLQSMKEMGLTKEDCIKHCKGKNRTVTDKELAMIETVFR